MSSLSTCRSVEFPQTVPELAGDGVRLRELCEDDVPAWYARATDAESAALAGDPIPESFEAGFAWLERSRERFRQRKSIRWAIVPDGSAESVGSIGLGILSEDARMAELGLVIGRAHWNRGIGTAAARLVTRFAFDSLGVCAIKAELLQSNVASKRLLTKAGFSLERVIPDFEQSDTGSEDGYLFVVRARDVR